jgi:5'-3' exoribonuclease 1
MTIWERDIFQKEYADVNWFKGKQTKHIQDMDLAQKRAKLGTAFRAFSSLTKAQSFLVLTRPQRDIFDKVQHFVLQNRRKSSKHRTAALTMPNTFPARERKFISTLAEELHLSVSWDEYDEDDQNLVTWRLPEVLEEPLPEADIEQVNGDAGSDDEWKDMDEEDDESRAAVDRVLKKFDKAPVMDDDEGGGFDARHEQSIGNKMAEWKRGYYKVRYHLACCSSD